MKYGDAILAMSFLNLSATRNKTLELRFNAIAY
jgi:hypothetical protein